MKSQYSQIHVSSSMITLMGRHNRSQFPKLMLSHSGYILCAKTQNPQCQSSSYFYWMFDTVSNAGFCQFFHFDCLIPTLSANPGSYSLVEILREDEVGRCSWQGGDASDAGGVGDANAHGFTHHQVPVTPAGSCRRAL